MKTSHLMNARAAHLSLREIILRVLHLFITLISKSLESMLRLSRKTGYGDSETLTRCRSYLESTAMPLCPTSKNEKRANH